LEFCREYDVEHETSSAHYPQSNGHNEACVKAMKDLTKKYWKGNMLDQKGFDVAILQWRNTLRDDGWSPAEWLLGRHLRGILPVHPYSLSRVGNHRIHLAELDRINRMQARRILYEEPASSLDSLKVGMSLWLQDPNRNNKGHPPEQKIL
jgi:Integrase core domain.